MTATLLLVLFAAHHVAPSSAYAPEGVGGWDRAVTQANIDQTICSPGYTALVRSGGVGVGPITPRIKREVYSRDEKRPPMEIDHYYPLELGGANLIVNLWAETWRKPYGARQKDKVETALHRLVCSGRMSLSEARSCIASDWVACGLRIRGE